MWRFKSLAISVALLGVLVFGAVTAYAGWYWNSAIDVEGVDVRTVWTVDGGEPADAAEDFFAEIKFSYPREADVVIMAEANTETVTLKPSKKYRCKPSGIEAKVQYKVEALDRAEGDEVDLTVTADGQVLATKTVELGDKATLKVFIPDGGACFARMADD